MSNNDQGIPQSTELFQPVLKVGYGNCVVACRIVAILESGSLPVRRLREKAGSNNRLVDATSGRKMRSLIITDSNHVVLSSLSPETLNERLRELGSMRFNPAQMEWEEGEFVS